MPDAGQLIYSGFVPLMKMGICIGAGFAIAKKGLFPPTAARGASHIAMDVSLPCLVFSSIVPAFNSDNISAMGSLVLNAIVYQIAGAVMGMMIKEIFWVPADFQYGIIMLCAFSNWGNLPTAVVQTIAKGEPFDRSKDPALGVAYVAVFILMYNVTFFGAGLCKICAWDFRPRPEGEEVESIRGKWRRWRRAAARLWKKMRARRIERKNEDDRRDREEVMSVSVYDAEKAMVDGKDNNQNAAVGGLGYSGGSPPVPTISRPFSLSRYQSHQHQEVLNSTQRHHDTISLRPLRTRSRSRGAGGGGGGGGGGIGRIEDDEIDMEIEPQVDRTAFTTPINTVTDDPTTRSNTEKDVKPTVVVQTPPTPPAGAPRLTTRQTVINFLKLFLTPVTISLIIAVPVALATPLKALFTEVPGWTGTKIPNGPDGMPPLAFLLDTAEFIGAICIPTGLILMGASFARLTVPRPFTKLPIGAIVSACMVKMVILPVIGVVMTKSLSEHTDLYPKSNKILIFVAMLLSGTPAAANQLVITQIYSPDGSADTLSSFMALQYAFMFIASSALAAVALSMVS